MTSFPFNLSRRWLWLLGIAMAGITGLNLGGNSAQAQVPYQVTTERRVQVWCEPVYRTVCDDVWAAPVYRTACDRVWHEPVYQVVCEEVWVPERCELRDVVAVDGCGCRVITRERVVYPGHMERCEHQLLVSAGCFEDVQRQVCVCEGHYDHVMRQELVTPGHYEYRSEPCEATAPYPVDTALMARARLP